MADTPKVQQPGTGTADPTSSRESGAHSDAAAPAAPQPFLDVRPVTLPSGQKILSGPLPNMTKGGGAGNTAGTPGYGFSFHGQAGGAFTIDGAGFNQVGNVFVGGKQVTVTYWQDNKIKGILPAEVDVKAEVLVVDGTGVAQRGPTPVGQAGLQPAPELFVRKQEEGKQPAATTPLPKGASETTGATIEAKK